MVKRELEVTYEKIKNFYLLIEWIMLRKILQWLGIYKLYEKWLYRQIKNGEKPKHIALILNGNRRWARKRNLPPWYGHRMGAKHLHEVLTWLLDLDIKIVTLYVLSTENLRRNKREVEELFKIIEEELQRALNDEIFERYEIKFKAIGKLDLLPERLRDLIRKLEEKTSAYNKRFLNIAIAYGGRVEIIEAVKKIALDVKRGVLDIEDINESTFEKYLFTSHLPQPSPDIIIRTSGEERLSNFLLWQSAYSELYFLEVYWPEFRKIDLWRAIRTYQQRERRFGR